MKINYETPCQYSCGASKQKEHASFTQSVTRRRAEAVEMTNSRNDVRELEVHHKLAKFSHNARESYRTSLRYSTELLKAVQELVKSNRELPDDLVGHIIMTIDTALYQDCHNSRSAQRRNRVAPSNGNLKQFDWSLDVLYSILRELKFEEIYDQIDGSLFCRHYSKIFIFPGYPSERERNRGWKFSHRRFLLPSKDNHPVIRISFDKVQHVVHNVKDLLNILHLTDPKRKNDVGQQLCLKGRPHFIYNGPDLIWFSPLPPPKLIDSEVCPSLDPDNSRYGCFRLTLPFKAIQTQYPKVYRLGTRKYNQEYCHSFLLTPSGKNVTFIEKLKPIQLAPSEFVENGGSNQLFWLCYRDDPDIAWDLVDFAVSASDLNLHIKNDQIRLDFINHSKPCVPSLKTGTCDSPITKTGAMQRFLEELQDIDIDISTLKDIFEDDIYNELIRFTM